MGTFVMLQKLNSNFVADLHLPSPDVLIIRPLLLHQVWLVELCGQFLRRMVRLVPAKVILRVASS